MNSAKILSEEFSNTTAALIQSLVWDLLDLSLQVKHAHWNVRGKAFLPVHEQLDSIHNTLLESIDELAERHVTLGLPIDGTCPSIASHSRVPPIHFQFLEASSVIEEVASRLLGFIGNLRSAIDVSGDLDAVTQDMLIGICGPLEKHLWMLQAQQQ